MTRALLGQALDYALWCARPVTAGALHRATPCHGWDLRELLWHLSDSLAALRAGVDGGPVELLPAAEPEPAAESDGHPLGEFRARARRLRRRCPDGPGTASAVRPEAPHQDPVRLGPPHQDPVRPEAPRPAPGGGMATVDGWPLAADTVALAGALEVAVHGWDIALACGLPRPVPPALAAELLRAASLLVPDWPDRRPLFGPPVRAPEGADHGQRLVAFLGRAPDVRSRPAGR